MKLHTENMTFSAIDWNLAALKKLPGIRNLFATYSWYKELKNYLTCVSISHEFYLKKSNYFISHGIYRFKGKNVL